MYRSYRTTPILRVTELRSGDSLPPHTPYLVHTKDRNTFQRDGAAHTTYASQVGHTLRQNAARHLDRRPLPTQTNPKLEPARGHLFLR